MPRFSKIFYVTCGTKPISIISALWKTTSMTRNCSGKCPPARRKHSTTSISGTRPWSRRTGSPTEGQAHRGRHLPQHFRTALGETQFTLRDQVPEGLSVHGHEECRFASCFHIFGCVRRGSCRSRGRASVPDKHLTVLRRDCRQHCLVLGNKGKGVSACSRISWTTMPGFRKERRTPWRNSSRPG